MNYQQEDHGELRKRADEINRDLVENIKEMSVKEVEELIIERNLILKKLGAKSYAFIYRE